MKTLRYGSRGADVELLQLALGRAGFDSGKIDGIFGSMTQDALINYQKSAALTPDGIAGTRTWNSLIKYIQGYFIRRIEQGDTFWNLADRYNTTVQAIKTANPNINPDNLRIGQNVIIPFGFSVVPTNITYTSHLTAYIINGLHVRYPFISTGTFGNSAMGKPLTVMRIGTGPTEVSYNASHHANEWITTPLVLKFVEEYALEYTIDGVIFDTPARELYSKASLFVMPLVNPDGVDLVNGALDSGGFFQNARRIAMNYPAIPFPSGWKANIRGVDLNLQYPANWDLARETKFAQGFTSPAPRDYVGSAPLSEPESQALYRYTTSRNFSLILAYHTQGKLIYWKYLDYLPPRSYEIARKMGDVSGYLVEETPIGSGYAGYKDWFIQQYNRPGYTIEAGIGENPLPISQFPEIYSDNLGIMTLGMSEVIN